MQITYTTLTQTDGSYQVLTTYRVRVRRGFKTINLHRAVRLHGEATAIADFSVATLRAACLAQSRRFETPEAPAFEWGMS